MAINYLGQMPQIDLGASLLQGLQIGGAIKDIRAQEAERERAIMAREQYANDVQAAFQANNPRAFAQLIAKYPQQHEALKPVLERMSTEQRDSEFRTAMQIGNALETGAADVALAIVDEQIAARKNSGMPTQEFDRIKAMIQSDPAMAKAYVNYGAAVADPEKYSKIAETFIKQDVAPLEKAEKLAAIEKIIAETGKVGSDMEVNQASMRNMASQIAERSARLGLDADRLALDAADKMRQYTLEVSKAGRPSDAVQKLINDGAVASTVATTAAEKAAALANRAQQLVSSGEYGATGAAGRAAALWKGLLGDEDQVSRFRQEVTALINSEAIKALPPGVATDRDIELVLAGFPSTNADPAIVHQFLRGIEKLNRVQAAFEEGKTLYATEFGGLAPAKRAATIGGVEVKPGMTYAQFAKRYAAANMTQPNETPLVKPKPVAPGDALAAQRKQITDRVTGTPPQEGQPRRIVVDF